MMVCCQSLKGLHTQGEETRPSTLLPSKYVHSMSRQHTIQSSILNDLIFDDLILDDSIIDFLSVSYCMAHNEVVTILKQVIQTHFCVRRMCVLRTTSTISHRVTQQCLVKDLNLSITSLYEVPRNISSRISSNSEADASELLENIEEMFSCRPWTNNCIEYNPPPVDKGIR